MSIFNKEVATLTLRTGDGVFQDGAVRGQCLFSGIDLYTVIGEMYNKYNKFNIVLTSMSNDGSSTYNNPTTTGKWQYNIMVCLSGLPFANGTYSFNNKGSTDTVNMGLYYTGTAGQINITQFPNNNIVTFNKPISKVNLTVKFLVASTGLPATLNETIYPICTLEFAIYGVEE